MCEGMAYVYTLGVCTCTYLCIATGRAKALKPRPLVGMIQWQWIVCTKHSLQLQLRYCLLTYS